MASLSLVPTPSVVATSTGSLNPAALRSNSAPKPPSSASAPRRARRARQRRDQVDQGVPGIDVDAGIGVGARLSAASTAPFHSAPRFFFSRERIP